MFTTSSDGTFCSVLSDVATRVSGPVVMFYGYTFFICRQEDVGSWELHRSQFNKGGIFAQMRRALRKNKLAYIPYWGRSKVRLYNDKMVKVPVISKINTVNIRSIVSANPGSLRDYTLVVFDMWSLTDLVLDDKCISTVADLDVLLVDLTLPALNVLAVKFEGIDPTVLWAFLHRHPTITKLSFDAFREHTGLH